MAVAAVLVSTRVIVVVLIVVAVVVVVVGDAVVVVVVLFFHADNVVELLVASAFGLCRRFALATGRMGSLFVAGSCRRGGRNDGFSLGQCDPCRDLVFRFNGSPEFFLLRKKLRDEREECTVVNAESGLVEFVFVVSLRRCLLATTLGQALKGFARQFDGDLAVFQQAGDVLFELLSPLVEVPI